MAIIGLDGWIAAPKQRVVFKKTAAVTSVALIWSSVFAAAGNPGAGTLAIGNTANGLVPTDATAGYPIINAFGGSSTGYLGRAAFSNSVLSRIRLYDRVFAAGAYAFNAATTLTSQPSYAGRMPGSLYNGTEIWIETVTAFTLNLSVAVTYTNQDGTTGRTTGTVATGAALIVGRCLQLPLQAGDSGVQKIESVTGTVASAGTFNVMVLRPLDSERIAVANEQKTHDFLATGMPQVYADSALYSLVNADSTSTGLPDCEFDVVNG